MHHDEGYSGIVILPYELNKQDIPCLQSVHMAGESRHIFQVFPPPEQRDIYPAPVGGIKVNYGISRLVK